MIHPQQLRTYIIEPALWSIDPLIPYSKEAIHLLIMTGAHESHLGTYIHQVRGPAQGIYQMEPATERDIWDNYLRHRGSLLEKVQRSRTTDFLENQELTWNFKYATIMARVHYWRVPEALPSMSDHDNLEDYITALANYAKKYFNTELGAATVTDYSRAFKQMYLDQCRKEFWETKDTV